MLVLLVLINLTFAQSLPLLDGERLQLEQDKKRQKIEEEYKRQFDAKKNEIRADMERKKYDKNYKE